MSDPTAPVPPSATPSRCGVHGPGGVGPCTCDETPSRSVHLLLSDLTLLEAWSDELRATIQQGLIGVYLVGSSLRTSDYRDVDVRIVVDDADHLALGCAVDLTRLHLALSLWGQRATGLPIDCQTQSLTESGAETGPIRPLNRKGRR